MSSLDELIKAFVELDENKVLSLVKELIDKVDPFNILEACRKATTIIGEKFEKHEYFLSELIYASEIFNQVMNIVLPKLKKEVKPIATIVLGTVEADIHDIGKNIFKAFAEAEGFNVIDLGIDVPSDRFVEAVRTHNPKIVGMSGLLTIALESMRKTIEALKKAGLRDRVKIIIGGGRVDEYAKKYTGADEWADNAMLGIKKCKQFLGVE